MIDNEEIVVELIKMRMHKHLSQRELAELANISYSTISRIERGITSPDIKTLNKLAYALGVNLIVKFERG